MIVNKISSKYLRTIIAVIFLLVSVTNRAMSDPSVLPPYPESSKPNVEEKGPATGQVQYAQQSYIQPGSSVQYIQQPYIQPGSSVQYIQQPYIQPGSSVQYIQQPYTQPGGQVHIIGQSFIDPSIALIHDWLPMSSITVK